MSLELLHIDCMEYMASQPDNSFDLAIVDPPYGMRKKETRIHPTQKPVALYKWLLKNYAKPGQRILDTHLGSGSSAIAAHDFGFDFVGCELDKDYFEAASARVKRHTAQLSFLPGLAKADPKPITQTDLFEGVA